MKNMNNTNRIIQSKSQCRLKSFDSVFMILSIAFVFFIAIFRIGQDNGIKLYPDEIGFWQNAALLSGSDWSGSASQMSYYGFGLGFLLTPIMMLFKTPTVRMHAAVCLQAALLCSCVVAIRWILIDLVQDIKKIELRVLSIVPVLYPAYLLFTKVTLAEVLLITCMWWWLYALLIFIKKGGIVSGVFSAVLPVYMYAVHQRVLPYIFVAVAVMLFVGIYRLIKNKKKKYILVAIGACLLLVIAYILTKEYENYYMAQLYRSAANESKVYGNTVEGRVGSVFSMLFSLDGLVRIFQSICGKLYYAIAGSFGLIFFGIVCGLASIGQLISNRSDNKLRDALFIIIFANFIIGIGIAAAASTFSSYVERADLLLYGRYAEQSFGPMIMIGCFFLYRNLISLRKERACLAIGVGITALLAVFCVSLTYDEASVAPFWVSCSAFGDLRMLARYYGFSNKTIVLIGGLRSIAMMLLLYFVLARARTREILLTIWVAVIAVLWIWIVDISWEGNVVPSFEKTEAYMIDISEDLEDEPLIGMLDVDMQGMLQFLLPNTYFDNIESIQALSDQYEGVYIITETESKYADVIRTKFVVDKENDRYIRWMYELRDKD